MSPSFDPKAQHKELLDSMIEAKMVGDRKRELLIVLTLVSEVIYKMHEGYKLIDDLLDDDHVSRLIHESHEFFPTDVSVEIEQYVEQVNQLWEPMDLAFDSSLQLLKELTSRKLIN